MKIQSFGTDVQGVTIKENRAKPEKEAFRVAFPGGHVDVVRATDQDRPDYWVHVCVDHPEGGMFIKGEDEPAHFVDARLDQLDKHASESNLGDFERPELYHVALRIARDL